MKAGILFFLLLFFSSLYLKGQENPKDSDEYSNKELWEFFDNYNKENRKYRIGPEEIPKIIDPYNEKHQIFESYSDSLLTRQYPGASRYYAKRGLSGSSYEKSFILEPGDSAEFYLIIKDPLRNTVTK